MKLKLTMVALAALAAMSTAQAAGFVNGGFEAGNLNGWTVGGGFRGSVNNPGLNPTAFLAGGALYDASIAGSHSAVVTKGTVDPNVGAAIGDLTFGNTNYSARVEDTTFGGYASVLTQTVTNYTDANIFFAWKAVLLGAHGVTDAATMLIRLTDLTDNNVLITRTYNAASSGGGVDPRFSLLNSNYYTPQWQIEQLAIGTGLSGHTFELSILAADCQPTGHWGYVYLDGFGAVTPPVGVPEPASLALVGLALAGAAGARRRAKKA